MLVKISKDIQGGMLVKISKDIQGGMLVKISKDILQGGILVTVCRMILCKRWLL